MIVQMDGKGRAIDYCVWVMRRVRDDDPEPVVVGKAHGATHDKALRGEQKIRDFLREDYG